MTTGVIRVAIIHFLFIKLFFVPYFRKIVAGNRSVIRFNVVNCPALGLVALGLSSIM